MSVGGGPFHWQEEGQGMHGSRLIHLFLSPGFSTTDLDEGHKGMFPLELDEIKKLEIFETKEREN